MFHTIFYQPLYNALVLLSSIVPGGDVGLAIICLTILVKIVLFPLFQSAAVTQMRMKQVEPEMALIKEKYKDDKTTQTKKVLEVYKTNKINPFSTIIALIIQIPIILALYWVFQESFSFNQAELYSFVSIPAVVSLNFLGFVDITAKSLILALLTGVTQYIQTDLTLPKTVVKSENKDKQADFKDSFTQSLNFNMRYLMPIFITYIAYTLSSAIALYWMTSNLFAIAQELYIRKYYKKV